MPDPAADSPQVQSPASPADPLPAPPAALDFGPTIHATAIAAGGVAALLLGRSGSGKSDLALRAMASDLRPLAPSPAVLVADDRVILSRVGRELFASPPPHLRGLMEVRGVGLLDVPSVAQARVVLAIELVDREVERLPLEPWPCIELQGVAIPRLELRPFEAAAPIKLMLLLARAARGSQGAGNQDDR